MKFFIAFILVFSAQAKAADNMDVPFEKAKCLEQAAQELVEYFNSEDSAWDYHIVRDETGLPATLKDISGDGAPMALSIVYHYDEMEEVIYTSEWSDLGAYALFNLFGNRCELLDKSMGQFDE